MFLRQAKFICLITLALYFVLPLRAEEKKNPLEQLITAKTWNFWYLYKKHEKIGLHVGVLRPKELVIPSELRYKSVKIGKLLRETAKFNQDLKLWYSEDKTRVLFYRKPDPEKLAEVKRGLTSKNTAILRTAIWEARWLAVPELILPLVKLSEHKEKSIRAQVLESLKQISLSACSICVQEQAMGFLGKALDDEDQTVFFSAILSLARIGREKTLPLIKKALKHKDRNIRIFAASALEKTGGGENAFTLVKKILKDKDTWVRRSVVFGLGTINKERALPLLIKALGDEDWSVRKAAITALGDLGGAKAIRLIAKALKDEDWDVRSHALITVGNLGGEKVLPLIKRTLEDKSSAVRGKAIEALLEIGGEKAFNLICKALKDSNLTVRHSAIIALGKIGNKKSLAFVKEALQDKINSVRASAVIALKNIGGEKVLPLIEKALEDKNSTVREYAVSILQNRDDKKMLPLIKKALKDKASKVRSSAAAALGYIGGERARNALLFSLTNETDDDVKEMIYKQLNRSYKYDSIVQAFLIKYPEVSAIERLSLKQAKAKLEQQGKIIFSQKDSLDKYITWLGLKEKFVNSFNARTGKLSNWQKKLQDLDAGEKPTATCLISLKDKAWVGTDCGLFQVNLAKGKVVQLAINFEIINCKVLSLKSIVQGIAVEVKTNKGNFMYFFKENKWVKK